MFLPVLFRNHISYKIVIIPQDRQQLLQKLFPPTHHCHLSTWRSSAHRPIPSTYSSSVGPAWPEHLQYMVRSQPEADPVAHPEQECYECPPHTMWPYSRVYSPTPLTLWPYSRVHSPTPLTLWPYSRVHSPTPLTLWPYSRVHSPTPLTLWPYSRVHSPTLFTL